MNQQEAAKALSVSTRTLQLWAAEDPPIPLKRISETEVEYTLCEIVRWFVAHEVSKALRVSGTSVEERKIAEGREAMAKAELREIELARVKGILVEAAAMKREETRLVLTVRQALLTVPHQLAVAFEDGLSYAERKAKAKSLVDSVLRILAQPDPEPAPDAAPGSDAPLIPKVKAKPKPKPKSTKPSRLVGRSL